jgi:hypothetical protein
MDRGLLRGLQSSLVATACATSRSAFPPRFSRRGGAARQNLWSCFLLACDYELTELLLALLAYRHYRDGEENIVAMGSFEAFTCFSGTAGGNGLRLEGRYEVISYNFL